MGHTLMAQAGVSILYATSGLWKKLKLDFDLSLLSLRVTLFYDEVPWFKKIASKPSFTVAPEDVKANESITFTDTSDSGNVKIKK